MKTILIIYDRDGWAWARIAQGIQKYAPPEYRVDITPLHIARGMTHRYDATLSMSWTEASRRPNGERHCCLVASHGIECEYPLHYLAQIPDRIATRLRNRTEASKKLPQFDSVLCVSDRLLEAAKVIVGDKAVVVYPGVDEAIFYPTCENGKGDILNVGWCGQSSGVTKGLTEIVQPLLRQQSPSWTLDVHGNTPDNAVDQDAMREWYNGIDVFLSTSCSEGCQMPVLEAMACGRPVIATDAGAIPETVQHNVTGMIFPAWKTAEEALVSKERIASLLRHMRDWRAPLWNMGRQAREYIEKYRTWKRMAPMWLKAIAGDA